MVWIAIKFLALIFWISYLLVGLVLLKTVKAGTLPRGQAYFFGLVYLLLLAPLSYFVLFIIMFGYNS